MHGLKAVGKPLGDLLAVLGCHPHGQRSRLDDACQALGQEFDRYEVEAAGLVHFEDLDDVRVVYRGGKRRLTPEAFNVERIAREIAMEDFERADAAGFGVLGTVDGALSR